MLQEAHDTLGKHRLAAAGLADNTNDLASIDM